MQVLREAGEDQAVTTLATRAVPVVRLDDPWAAGWLVEVLREAGEDQAVTTLASRAAECGLWHWCLQILPNMTRQYAFGREPSGAASAPWDWQYLIDQDREAPT